MHVPNGPAAPLCQPCLLVPIAAAVSERVVYKGLVVQLAGLTLSQEFSASVATCVRTVEASPDRWVVRLPSGRRTNADLKNLRQLNQLGAEPPGAEEASRQALPIKRQTLGEVQSKMLIEARDVAHVPHAAWREVRMSAKVYDDHYTAEQEERSTPLFHVDYQCTSATGEECPETIDKSKATLLTLVDEDFWIGGSIAGVDER